MTTQSPVDRTLDKREAYAALTASEEPVSVIRSRILDARIGKRNAVSLLEVKTCLDTLVAEREVQRFVIPIIVQCGDQSYTIRRTVYCRLF